MHGGQSLNKHNPLSNMDFIYFIIIEQKNDTLRMKYILFVAEKKHLKEEVKQEPLMDNKGSKYEFTPYDT